MKVTLTSTGGFAGPAAPETISIDLDRLQGGPRAEILRALQKVDPQAVLSGRNRTSADFQHVLVVETGGAPWTLRFHDGEATPQLRNLIGLLRDTQSEDG